MKKLVALALAGLMTVSIAGCGSTSNKSGKTTAKGTVTMGSTVDLTGQFSPVYYSSSYDGYVVNCVYDSMMKYDINSKLEPSLATKADVAKDGKSVTFDLRKDVKFSDGSPLTAKDVEFTFKYLSDPSYDGRYGSTVQYLDGYDNYSDPKNKTEPAYPGIKVDGDYKITFTTKTSRNDNLSTFALFPIMSSKQFKDVYKYGDTSKGKDLGKTPIGTGPYVLKKWEAGTGASLVRNDNYWGTGYNIKNVIIKPIKSTTDYQELASKHIDILPANIEPSKIGPATNNKDISINTYPRGGLGYITLNAVNGATSDKAVRQALLYGFDRQSFVNSFYECKDCKFADKNTKIGYVPTTYQNPLSPMGDVVRGTKKVDGLTDYAYNLDKAKQILDDAGWKVGSNGKRSKDGQALEIKVLATEDNSVLDNLIPIWNKSWGQELGATVKIATVNFNTLIDKVTNSQYSKDWNVFFLATSFTSDGMTDILSTFDSSQAKDGGDNYSRLKDPTLDKMLSASLTEMDADKALKDWEDVAVRVNDDAAVLPVYGNTYFDFYSNKIKNFKTGPLYDWTRALKNATVE